MPSLLVGLTGYELLWATARCFVVLGAAAAFGFHAHWVRFGEAAVILAMIVATYFGAGMLAGAMIIAYRRTGQLQTLMIVGSAMIGGVLYPTKLVPQWAARFSDLVPMTYGIRAVRRITIDDWPLRAVLADVGMLGIFCVAFLALRFARDDVRAATRTGGGHVSRSTESCGAAGTIGGAARRAAAHSKSTLAKCETTM